MINSDENLKDIEFLIEECHKKNYFFCKKIDGDYYCELSLLEPEGLEKCCYYGKNVLFISRHELNGTTYLKYHVCLKNKNGWSGFRRRKRSWFVVGLQDLWQKVQKNKWTRLQAWMQALQLKSQDVCWVKVRKIRFWWCEWRILKAFLTSLKKVMLWEVNFQAILKAIQAKPCLLQSPPNAI